MTTWVSSGATSPNPIRVKTSGDCKSLRNRLRHDPAVERPKGLISCAAAPPRSKPRLPGRSAEKAPVSRPGPKAMALWFSGVTSRTLSLGHLSLGCPSGQPFKIKHIASYWNILAIAAPLLKAYNLSQSESLCSSQGQCVPNFLRLSCVKSANYSFGQRGATSPSSSRRFLVSLIHPEPTCE